MTVAGLLRKLIPIDRGALVAPRPALVVTPTLDRCAPAEALKSEVEEARRVHEPLGQAEALRLDTSIDFNRFMEDRQQQVINWIAELR